MKHVQADSSNFVHRCLTEVSLEMMKTFLRGDPFLGVEQRLQQVDPLQQVQLPGGTFGDNVVTDELIRWFVLGCIVLASCSVGFIFGRWSNSCSCSTKSTNYESVPGSSNAPDEESVELVEVT